MKRSLFIAAILSLAAFSCQESVDPVKLKEQVLASREFAAFVEAYENRGADLMNEKKEESQKLLQELENLSPEEKKARREKAEAARQAEAEKERQNRRLMEERNHRIKILLAGEKKLSKTEFEAAVREIDTELSISPEVAMPARTRRMKEAMASLLDKFPGIREQGADFIKDCLSDYKAQQGK